MNPSRAPLASADELANTSRRERQLAAARNTDRSTATRLETETERHQTATVRAQEREIPRDGYRYKATLRNDSAKTVKSIDWDYLFIDPATEEVVMRHQFTSDETIKPGKTKEIGVLYLNKPVKTVNVRVLAGKDPMPYKEQVIVTRILYSDGTAWQLP